MLPQFALPQQTQQQKNDSLWHIWESKSINDTVRIEALNKLAFSIARTNPDSAVVLAKKMRENTGQLNNRNVFLGKGFYNEGIAYYYKADFAKSDSVMKLALEMYEKTNRLRFAANTLNILAMLAGKRGNSSEALEYHLKSLKTRTEIKDTSGIGDSYTNIAIVYANQKEYNTAISYNQKAIEVYKSVGAKKKLALPYNNLGVQYKFLEDLENALKYYQLATEIRQEYNDIRGLSGSYNNIGNIYEEQGENSKAETYFKKALKIRLDIGDNLGVTELYNNMGMMNVRMGNYAKGVELCNKGYQQSKKIKVLLEEKDACYCLELGYYGLDKFKEAFKFQQEFFELKDSLFNEEKTKELTRLEMNYAFEQEQDSLAAVQRELDLKNQAQLQKAEATRNYSIGGFGAAAVLALLMYSRFSMSRKKNRIIQSEKDRSEELLLNILPLETAQELKEKGVVQAKHHDEVTVLFADITNFTQLSERIPPQELVATIHTYFSAFDQIMEKHGIEKIKTIGDAYMAASGLQNKPEQAKRMVQAAQEMLQYVRENPLSDDINFRVGIHTGPVVSGVVGVKKFAYDIWGDTVNTAARMESASEPGKINISEATQQKIKDYFEHTSRGKVAIKGKGEMEMFFVNANAPSV